MSEVVNDEQSLLECLWKILSFHLCSAQRHKIIQRLPAAQNLFVPRQRERETLCVYRRV